MKSKISFPVILLLSILSWSCSNNDLGQASLKDSMNKSVQELATAMNKISTSNGYQVLAISSGVPSNTTASLVKSSVAAFDTTYSSIKLADIAGIYDYKAVKYKRGGNQLFRFFTKSGTSDHMIVRLPESKLKNPSGLLHYSPSDTLLVNNYIIDLSKYEYNFNRRLGWNYQMISTINIKDVNVGALAIQSSSSIANGYKYASEFVFADGYKASCTYASGDTAVTSYAINDGSKVLYSEKYTAIRGSKNGKHKEKQYTLTIGNVEIVRGLNHEVLDSAKVYVGGVLQKNAKVEIVDINTSDDDSDDVSVINKNRELKITFDDGTSATISDLLGTSVTTIRTLFASLRQSTFAVGIVDWIAWDIYTNKE
ncbi:MAG: hypothetical protein PHR83_10750 [Paludibacter sp.]|nr:hypothetical protein [Paludibacter sp.]